MTGGRNAIIVVVVSGGIALSGAVLRERDTARPLQAATERALYVRSPTVAKRLFLSFDALASDVYWIRTIQHYGRDRMSARTTDRFQLLEPLLELTTALDPHFNVAYRFGAIFLSMEPPNGPHQVGKAIALLEKGLARNLTRWQYAHDLGFVHYWHTGDYREAARWFAKAAEMPGAPGWLAPLAAVTLAKGGDREGARQMLLELVTASERYIRLAAERSLAQLKALDDTDVLQSLVEKFHSETGRYPATWSDLIAAGTLRSVPTDPTNTPYVYSPSTHIVALSAESSLAPLPRTLTR